MAISEDDVRHVANLARLSLDNDEVSALTKDFSNIVDLIDKIGESDCAEVTLSSQRVTRRPDTSVPCEDSLLTTVAPNFNDQHFVVPQMAQHQHTEDKPMIRYEDFQKMELKTGRIIEAAPHPKADRLLILTVDVGEDTPRTIVAGLAVHYPDPTTLCGQTVIAVTNLEPATLRGVTSEGMLLAAGGKDHLGLLTVHTHAECPTGQIVR